MKSYLNLMLVILAVGWFITLSYPGISDLLGESYTVEQYMMIVSKMGMVTLAFASFIIIRLFIRLIFYVIRNWRSSN